MPLNNTPIAPPEEVTGQNSLPLARVKKIINADEDIHACSANAAFVVTIAAEMFIQYFAEQAHNIVKSERKPRRNIAYKDVANAVARFDNLEFLSDVVPRTMKYREYKKEKAKEEAAKAAAQSNGQATLGSGARSSKHRQSKGAAGRGKAEKHVDGNEMQVDPTPSDDQSEDAVSRQLQMEMRGPRTNGTVNGNHTTSSSNEVEL